jgi:hypothetical protein
VPVLVRVEGSDVVSYERDFVIHITAKLENAVGFMADQGRTALAKALVEAHGLGLLILLEHFWTQYSVLPVDKDRDVVSESVYCDPRL